MLQTYILAMLVQLCEYTKSHWVCKFQMVYHLDNKDVKPVTPKCNGNTLKYEHKMSY